MKKNIFLSISLILISSCSTLAFWSDDSEEDLIEPVSLESIKDEYSISVEWKKSFTVSYTHLPLQTTPYV